MCAMMVKLHPQHTYMLTVTNEVSCTSLRQGPNSIYRNIARLATCFVPDDDVICLRIQEYTVNCMCRSTYSYGLLRVGSKYNHTVGTHIVLVVLVKNWLLTDRLRREFPETKDNNGKFEDLTALPIRVYV